MFKSVENKFKIYCDGKEFEPDEVNNILSDKNTASGILIYTLRDLLNSKSEGLKWFVDRGGESEELYLFYYPYDQKKSDPYKLYVVKDKKSLNDIRQNGHGEKRFFANIGNVSKEIIFFDDDGIEESSLLPL